MRLNGILMASLPLGYNIYFDGLIENGQSPFTTQHFLSGFPTRTIGLNQIGKGGPVLHPMDDPSRMLFVSASSEECCRVSL